MRKGSPSILPNSSPEILKPMQGQYGMLVVRWLGDDADMHGLFYASGLTDNSPYWVIAAHHNGYSCHELAKCVLAHWAEKGTENGAMEQFQYILDCGGMGIHQDRMREIVQGLR